MLLRGSCCISIDAWCYSGDKSDTSSTALPGGTDTNSESSVKKVHFEKGTCVENKTVPVAKLSVHQGGLSSVVECSTAYQKPKQSKSRNVNEEEDGVYEVEAILSHRKVSRRVMWSHGSSTPA